MPLRPRERPAEGSMPELETLPTSVHARRFPVTNVATTSRGQIHPLRTGPTPVPGASIHGGAVIPSYEEAIGSLSPLKRPDSLWAGYDISRNSGNLRFRPIQPGNELFDRLIV